MSFNQNSSFGLGSSSQGGGGGNIDSANNGLIVDGTTVQFGQPNSEPGTPAAILENRIIPIGEFEVSFTGETVLGDPTFVTITKRSIDMRGDGGSVPPTISMIDGSTGNTAEIELNTTGNTGFSFGVNSQKNLIIAPNFFLPSNRIAFRFIDNVSDLNSSIASFQMSGNLSVQYGATGVSFDSTLGRAVDVRQKARYDLSGGAMYSYGLSVSNTATKTGTNELNNVGLFVTAEEGDFNYSIIADQGKVLIGGLFDTTNPETVHITDSMRVVSFGLNDFITLAANNNAPLITLDGGNDALINFTQRTGTSKEAFAGFYYTGLTVEGLFGFWFSQNNPGFVFDYNSQTWAFATENFSPSFPLSGALIDLVPDPSSISQIVINHIEERNATITVLNSRNNSSDIDAALNVVLRNDDISRLTLQINGSTFDDGFSGPSMTQISSIASPLFFLSNTDKIGFVIGPNPDPNNFTQAVFLQNGNFILATGGFNPIDYGNRLQVQGSAFVQGPLYHGISIRNSEILADYPSTQNAFFTNGGSGGVPITVELPAAVVGAKYNFAVIEVGSLILQAQPGDTIRIGANISSAGGQATSSFFGSSLTLICSNSGEWFATAGIEISSFILS